MRRKWVLIGAAAVLLLGAAVFWLAYGSRSKPATPFHSVQPGMSKTEVEAILARPPDDFYPAWDSPRPGEMWTVGVWIEPGYLNEVVFDDDLKVSSKASKPVHSPTFLQRLRDWFATLRPPPSGI
jgi:hypothetical protein